MKQVPVVMLVLGATAKFNIVLNVIFIILILTEWQWDHLDFFKNTL